MRNSLLFQFGGALKVLETKGDQVTIGGGSVLYDEPGSTRKDLTGEYFMKDTWLGHNRGDGADPTFHHGFPLKAEGESFPNDFALGLAQHVYANPWRTEDTDEALIASLVTDMRNKYERFTAEKVMAGEVSLSSGAVGHLVRKSDDGAITHWPIGEIAVTPTPAEPRLGLLTLKSFLGIEGKATKAESLSARVERIYDAFYRQFDWYGWVAEVFEGHVIISWDGNLYRVSYTEAEGTVTFAHWENWERVEREVSYASKSIYEAHIRQFGTSERLPLALELSNLQKQFALS